MTVHHHDLGTEFPQFKEAIHDLKASDHHFAKLFAEYEAIDKEIVRIEQDIQPTSDEYAEEQKKKRVALKDELYQMLKAHAA